MTPKSHSKLDIYHRSRTALACSLHAGILTPGAALESFLDNIASLYGRKVARLASAIVRGEPLPYALADKPGQGPEQEEGDLTHA